MITNKHNISLNMAVWLAHDDYDYIADENYISATGLLKPIKAIILSRRAEKQNPDVMDFVASRIGTAIHDSSEKAWKEENFKKNMYKLGHPENLINNIVINPEKVLPGQIPIYLEKRTIKSLNGYRIGGKFDAVFDGNIRDIKSVKAFSYMKNDDTDYILQMSIYRWLNPEIIKGDIGFIDMIVTDWKQYEFAAKPDVYPPTQVLEKSVPLLSLKATEKWLSDRISILDHLRDMPESELPVCDAAELWQDLPKYAYYKKTGAKRATKVFDIQAEANQRLLDDGSTGFVEIRAGKPKRCNYCAAATICNQAQGYISQGLL